MQSDDFPLGRFRPKSAEAGEMDESESAAKELGLEEAPEATAVVPGEEGENSDTESEAEVTTMAVMGEPGNIELGAESLPNPDEAAFAGKLRIGGGVTVRSGHIG